MSCKHEQSKDGEFFICGKDGSHLTQEDLAKINASIAEMKKRQEKLLNEKPAQPSDPNVRY